ncbi:MAG: bifunctional hydroxymethylpyrimidine kinase/phosphomethylpyrimidine kinase [Sphingomonas sp.]
MSRCPRVLIVAGSDSGGGAGVQADIKTVTMLGGHAMTAITAITAQNTLGVTGVWPLPVEAVVAQIDAVVADLGVDAVKIGMIGSADVAEAVADRLAGLADAPIIFDPVMIATSGSVLADPATVAAFDRLMARAALVTPNLPELAALAGLAPDRIDDAEAMAAAARALAGRTGAAVLVKGGHAAGPVIHDRLVTAAGVAATWRDARIETRHSHGTGCTLASGIATGLGAGLPLADAIGRARAYVRAALSAAPGYGAGHGPMGHALGGAPFDAVPFAPRPAA